MDGTCPKSKVMVRLFLMFLMIHYPKLVCHHVSAGRVIRHNSWSHNLRAVILNSHKVIQQNVFLCVFYLVSRYWVKVPQGAGRYFVLCLGDKKRGSKDTKKKNLILIWSELSNATSTQNYSHKRVSVCLLWSEIRTQYFFTWLIRAMQPPPTFPLSEHQ